MTLRYRCEQCRTEIRFDTMRCPVCSAHQGYVPNERTVRAMAVDEDAVTFRVAGDTESRWRCLNAAWGCNWTLPAAIGESWCQSCALTRGRPDVARPDAIDAWSQAEAAKRHLVDQLLRLGLPVHVRSPARPNGLTFDLVDVPGVGGLTGHLDGVVTIDLAETDDQHRDRLRRSLGEEYRTLIGHLRHEVGHHYWDRLVGESSDLADARRLFGDERAEYGAALEHHYASTPGGWDDTRYVSRYAAAHPAEDWAETFAHHLHLVDIVETATSYGLAPRAPGASVEPEDTFRDLVGAWGRLEPALEAVAAAVGSPPVFPFRPTGLVVDKLEFVDRSIRAHRRRREFYRSSPTDRTP